ncbi:kremen protein 1 isoform X4 [Macaca fascicularis]|uniref:kremen protein 1 isoform X4 n=1 Tax=Macaca fascicularis TaxID=9541 RepID=UPI0032B07D5F
MAPPAARLALLSAAALTLAARPAPSPGLGPGPECFTANGADYRGTQNWTALQGGKPCLFWNETFQHPYNTLKYPNGEGGLGEHNYCRNPDGDVSPWCYVAEHEDGVYWKYCEIPACQTLVGACGGNYSAMSSVVYSPDFPDTYATGRVCYWTIRVPGASRIHFSFPLFDIRDSADMVELLDGYTHRVLARFHGRNRPPLSFNVSLDFVILYFFSDRINQAQGFAVLYQAVKEELPQERPAVNQTVAEVITEQANLSVSAARSSKVLYVITTSPSHPPQTVPGSNSWAPPMGAGSHRVEGWTVYGLATLLILTVTAIVAKILLHVTFKSHRVPASGDLRDCHQPGTSGEIWSIFYKPSTSISIFKKKLKGQSQQDDRNPLEPSRRRLAHQLRPVVRPEICGRRPALNRDRTQALPLQLHGFFCPAR